MKKEDEKSKAFKARKNASKDIAAEILAQANMVVIAKHLLKKYSFNELNRFEEKDLAVYCWPYDPAMVVTIAYSIEMKKPKPD